MYCDKEENIDIYTTLFNSITEAKEILNEVQKRAEYILRDFSNMESIHSYQLDKESLISFLHKLEDILTPSQIHELEPIFITFMELFSYRSYKQGIRLGLGYKLSTLDSKIENNQKIIEISV